ncbi:MAG TPA: TIR domain-containing protein [Candidatus Angelobacter sp.]|nr:TIR domain-containing protein [Candidatus Angelobacter sp.]
MSEHSYAYDVFLSYSSKDKAIVVPLAERLKADGLRVWLDTWEIRAGDNIPAKIEEGLEHSGVLVLCMSANAFGSDWATLESQTFRFRDPLNRQRRFVPLRLDDAEPRGSIGQFAYIDWRRRGETGDGEYQRLLVACQISGSTRARKDEKVEDREAKRRLEDQLEEKIISLGHTGGINSVAFSPDGKRALSGSDDKTVRVWDVESGSALQVLEGHTDRVWSVAWSVDGKRALSGSADQTVRVWDVESGRALPVLGGHTAIVRSVAWSGDGKRALSGSDDKTVRVWDVESGRALRVLEGHTDGVWSVAWSGDGKHALSGSCDQTVRVWDVESGRALRMLEGHTNIVRSVAWSVDGKRALSGSYDKTVRVWDVESGRALQVLEGHTAIVWGVAWSGDGKRALSGSEDKTVRVWDVESGRALRVLEGHTDTIRSVAWSGDGKRVLSGSEDKTVRLWDVWRALRVLKGHTASVWSVAWSVDGKRALSGSKDTTVRLWDVESGRALRVLEGHTASVWSVAWSVDGKRALSGSEDKTVRLWDVESGRTLRVLEGHTASVRSVAWSADGERALSGSVNGVCRLWNLAEITQSPSSASSDNEIQYTNAKVLLVGESGSGKTGLTERLAHNQPPRGGPSTSGAWSTQWPLKNFPQEIGWEREIWLWDFGGQADQRLIHQLYLDHTALVLLMFDADQETVLSGLREWQQALARSMATSVPAFLVAGRTDVGFRFDRAKVQNFAQECGYGYFETSAQTEHGIPELRKAMLDKIPWRDLPVRSSPTLFKRLKDEILKLRDQAHVLVTFKELESILRHRLPPEERFTEAQLEAVISLLDGPGVLKKLNFGSYIVLRPEWINIYAQAIIRTLRASESGLGYLPVRSIMEGKLIFQNKKDDPAENRLGPGDEKVVLQAMEQTLLERRLCLREGGDLVFPSYCGLERPVGPAPPPFFVSYTIRGFLDDIYATLVVKLAHCNAFKLKELWRDAADFETLAEQKIVGVRLMRREDGRGDLLAHHAPGLSMQEQVIFANYIHEHLREKSTEVVPRLRFYTCPHCHQPVKDRELAMELLEKGGVNAMIQCQRCNKAIPLWDRLERLFASPEVKSKVEALRQNESSDLDSRRLGKLLVLEVSSRITSANQKCYEIPGDQDEGIDLVVEFTDEDGKGTGQQMYLQLKAGNSHLKTRKSDEAEVFTIKKQSWVKQWIRQNGPMMLVVGTFPEEAERNTRDDKKTFAEVRWMEIGELLRNQSENGKKPVKQIIFKGERLDAQSVRRWREKSWRGF